MNSRAIASVLAAVLAAGTFASALAAPAASPWENLSLRSIGPAVAGGRVAAVAGTDQNPDLYYIGTAGGGVWKTENGAQTWSPVFGDQDVSAIGAVAIDPKDENTVYAGTGEANPRNNVSYGNGLYKTTDGGKKWTRVGLAGVWSISRIAIDPQNPNHVVVGAFGDPYKDSTDRGVYVTFDGGSTWNKSLYIGPKTGASDIAMDPSDPTTVYAGMWEFRRLPWTFSSGGTDDGLYKSTDGGKTFVKLTGHGLPEGMTGRIGLAIAQSNPKRVYAIIEAKGGILWRSDDGGANWTMISNDTLVDQRPFYFTHINVDPKNPDHVYAVSEMLAESKDGGKKFEEIAKNVHVDYHAMWISSTNPSRMMTGEDGGYALTLDGGKHWSFSRNLAIGQIYHVGMSNENPYWVCGGLQDNGGFCGPSNSLDPEGILDSHWNDVIGGDGMWTVPDPIDPRYVWADLEDGFVAIFDRQAQSTRFINPYFTFGGNLGPFDLREAKYRFNWDSPIAFAPWDGHIGWYGGNVVFQTTDRGYHWKPISPDLTRNIKEHQKPAGGPLASDVSGAEYSDNILYIEGSQRGRGEIWVGTDDGLVQLTRDGGAHWRNVTPPGTPEFARIEATSPSALVSGTAYVVADNHRMGDYAPYAYVTRDYGRSWTKIVDGLPGDQYVRTIRPDPRNANIVYAGTENGMFISFDAGAHWQDFRVNLPHVSVRDIRIQPQFNDLVVATHGRDIWILDDLTPIQQLQQAQAGGAMLFPVRTAYEYHQHANDLGNYTRFSGQNPPTGAMISFYQKAAAGAALKAEILDASGHVVRTISGTHKAEGKEVPNIPNKAGVNRFTWDFHEDGPVLWTGAAKEEYQGPKTGPMVVPGSYRVRMVIDGKTQEQAFTVKPDPRDTYSPAQYRESFAFAKKYETVQSKIDEVLNHLDAIGKSLAKAPASDAVAKAKTERERIFDLFTANYQNDEDSIQRPGALREEIPRAGGFGGFQPVPEATKEYAVRYDAKYREAMQQYNAYVASLKTLGVEGAIPVTP